MYQRIDSVKAGPLDEVYGFLQPGELLADPMATQYARAWDVARADTFRRVR